MNTSTQSMAISEDEMSNWWDALKLPNHVLYGASFRTVKFERVHWLTFYRSAPDCGARHLLRQATIQPKAEKKDHCKSSSRPWWWTCGLFLAEISFCWYFFDSFLLKNKNKREFRGMRRTMRRGQRRRRRRRSVHKLNQRGMLLLLVLLAVVSWWRPRV